MKNLQPHPYALMLPPLTEEEYAALKSGIAEHGILCPIITDADGQILDGVHRVRIAGELGIEPPVSQMGQLDDERKLQMTIGLNTRRRHLDAHRRHRLVRQLHREQGLSVRKIASVTGWSKSTIDRDLKTTPFEAAMRVPRRNLINAIDNYVAAYTELRPQVVDEEELRVERDCLAPLILKLELLFV